MNLPHPLDRRHQLETAQRILQSEAQYIIVNAKTGSGKTAYAAYAASRGYKTLATVRTKSLQTQYEKYGFYSITGKGDYRCLNFDRLKCDEVYTDEMIDDFLATPNPFELPEIATADLCTITQCECKQPKAICSNRCEYPIARQRFLHSRAGITNYAKFLLDRKLIDDFNPNIIFLDEAHELGGNPSIVIDFSGRVFKWSSKWLMKYTSPTEIKLDEGLPGPIAHMKTLEAGREWLQDLYYSLKAKTPQHPLLGGDRAFYKWHERLLEKVDIVLACMDIEPRCWYVRADEKSFTCKPLTSQFHFTRLFDKARKIVLMSATIQEKDIKALGIEDYEFIKVPSTIPAPMRPVYDLKAPDYKNGMSYQDKKEHAAIIAKVFNDRPGWNGLIHVTSEEMAWELYDRFRKYIDNPVWIPEPGNTSISYDDWQAFNAQHENAICISWQFFAGVDMGDVAINITARTPYPYFGDDYEKARFKYNPGQARVRVGNTIEQQQGRNRRGFNEHYGPMARKFCGIADGKWHKLRSALNKDFLRSIV